MLSFFYEDLQFGQVLLLKLTVLISMTKTFILN